MVSSKACSSAGSIVSWHATLPPMRHAACLSRRKQARKERLQRAREFEEAAWAQAAAEAVSDEEVEQAEALPDELYCLACDKTFRTENALANHQKFVTYAVC